MMGLTADALVVFVPLVLLGLGYVVGRWREHVHLRSLERREQALAGMMVLAPSPV